MFGNIFIMIFWYDKLKAPHRRMHILSHMTYKSFQYPPTKVMKYLEEKDNPVAILTMKVCVFVFDCYDVIILILFLNIIIIIILFHH